MHALVGVPYDSPMAKDKVDWVALARDDAQPRVAEPITAIGWLQPAGSWGAFGISKLSGWAGTAAQSDANERAKGLAKSGGFKPKAAMLAVTASTIHVFSASPTRSGTMKVGDLIAVWPRDEITISVAPGKLAAQVTIDVPETGDRFELEATTIRDFNDAFLAAVAPPG